MLILTHHPCWYYTLYTQLYYIIQYSTTIFIFLILWQKGKKIQLFLQKKNTEVPFSVSLKISLHHSNTTCSPLFISFCLRIACCIANELLYQYLKLQMFKEKADYIPFPDLWSCLLTAENKHSALKLSNFSPKTTGQVTHSFFFQLSIHLFFFQRKKKHK